MKYLIYIAISSALLFTACSRLNSQQQVPAISNPAIQQDDVSASHPEQSVESDKSNVIEQIWVEEAQTSRSPNVFLFRDDKTYLHFNGEYSNEGYDFFTEGEWFDLQDNKIYLTQTTQYLRFLDNGLRICIPIPKDKMNEKVFDTSYTVDAAGEYDSLTIDWHHYKRKQSSEKLDTFLREKSQYITDDIPYHTLLNDNWSGLDSEIFSYDQRDGYIFDKSGIFAFAESYQRPAVRRRLSAGNWWVEDGNILCLSATHEVRIEGGTEIDGEIAGGDLVEREIPESQRQVTKYQLTLMPIDPRGYVRVRMGEYTIWKWGGENVELYRFLNRHYPELIRPNPYTKEESKWFSVEMRNYADDFIHESWDATDNVERLDRFYQNYKNGISDRILLQQDGNPAFELFEIIYNGDGRGYTVQILFESPGAVEFMGNISLIDNYYYFTQGDVSVENNIIIYEKDGEVIQVVFDTFPLAQGQPMKIGRDGSGWVHP